jgi:PelA/Pel-15E family pectate lyase
MPFVNLRLLFILSLLSFPLSFATAESNQTPIDTSRFQDNIGHYQALLDSKEYPRYKESQCVEIGDNILLMQRDNGGWSSNWDPLRIIPEEEMASHLKDKGYKDSTLDNNSSYTHTLYLAELYERSGEERFQEGALKGLNYLLEAQYDNGGWPHNFPLPPDYRRYITITDDVMIGVLSTLLKVWREASPFSFLEDSLRERVREAWERGHQCLLDLQVRVDGVPTIWAGQYHEETLEPSMGRNFELPGLISRESVSVVLYLMKEAPQSTATVQAIEYAMKWFERSQIHGLRIEQIKIEPIQYTFRVSRKDVVEIPDPEAPPIWARFYEIDTNKPFLADRDGTKVYALAELSHERRSGYGWYGTWPAVLLDEEYPRWKAARVKQQ